MGFSFGAFLREPSGTTNIEYGLIGALFAIVCIAGYTLVGSAMSTQYQTIANTVNGAVTN